MTDDLVARLKRRDVGRMEYFSMGITNMSQWIEGDQDCAEAAARITTLESILRAILEADERGQGQPFAEAMERAHVALGRSPARAAEVGEKL